LNTFQHIHYC